MKWLEPEVTERGHFDTNLTAEQYDRWEWGLTRELVYQDPVHGTITVPAGFKTNFASLRILRTLAVALILTSLLISLLPLPAVVSLLLKVIGAGLIILYAALIGYGNAASAVHDYLYDEICTLGLSRPESDDVIYRAARAEGVARWRASPFYIGVRIGGKSHYKTPISSGFSI